MTNMQILHNSRHGCRADANQAHGHAMRSPLSRFHGKFNRTAGRVSTIFTRKSRGKKAHLKTIRQTTAVPQTPATGE